MGSFVPVTDSDRKEMLYTIGIKNIEELFAGIPEKLKVTGELNLPSGLSEMEASSKMHEIADRNKIYKKIFRGAGAYNHYIPAIVPYIINKENLLTSYTPYQAEISQGILQSIFEYQTYMCELTGMDVSNAGVYDGAEAAAEAVNMCIDRKKTKVLVSESANPYVISVIKTYCFGSGMELKLIPEKNCATDIDALKEMITDDTACVYIAQPNFYGTIEDAATIATITHERKAKFIIGADPISLAILKTPMEYGADIAVGEGQPLGLPLSFGGPFLGFMASTESMMRKLPGRIVGETKDSEGKTGYVLTLQAREQHIRREKASSNICTNEALCALCAGVYLSTMGAEGIREVAVSSMSKAYYLAGRLESLGFTPLKQGRTFCEFVTESPVESEIVVKKLSDKGILGGLPLTGTHKGELLWCCTEMNSKNDIDELIEVLKEVK